MLSPKNTLRTILSLVLIAIFTSGSDKLRISVGTMLIWALGLIVHHRLRLSPAFLKGHIAFIITTFGLLAACNELFYETAFGHIIDLFLERPSYYCDTPGSGFTDWHERFSRRHRGDIAFAWRFVRFCFWLALSAVALPCGVAFAHWMAKEDTSLSAHLQFVTNHTGEQPPWLVKAPLPVSPPKRDTRYVHMGDGLIMVCGAGGGFERVVDGDYEAAIARRRALTKQFA
jgi:hypothetical protein